MKKLTIRCVTGTDTARACGYKTLGWLLNINGIPHLPPLFLSLSISTQTSCSIHWKTGKKKGGKGWRTGYFFFQTDGSVTLRLVGVMILPIGLTAKEAIAVEGTNLNIPAVVSVMIFLIFFKRRATKSARKETFPSALASICFAFFLVTRFHPSLELFGLFVVELCSCLFDCFSFFFSRLDGDTWTGSVCWKRIAFQPAFRLSHVRNERIPWVRPPAESRDFKLGMETLEWRGERKAQSAYRVRMLEQ